MTPAAYKQAWNDYAQSLRLWAVEFVIWLAAVTQWRELRLLVRTDLRFLRRRVRDVLIARMAAVCHKDRRPRGHGIGHWPSSPLSTRRFRRYVVRGVVLRTFDGAKRVLEDLEAYVARCIANFRTGVKPRGRARKPYSVASPLTAVGEGANAPDSS